MVIPRIIKDKGPGRNRGAYSEAEKRQIVLEADSGNRRLAATARRYGVTSTAISHWRNLYAAPMIASEDTKTGDAAVEQKIEQRSSSPDSRLHLKPIGESEFITLELRRRYHLTVTGSLENIAQLINIIEEAE